MGEHLVDAHVVGAPAEVGRRHGLLACTGRAGDGVHCNVVGEESGLCQGQQTELYASGEAAGVGQVLALADLLLVYLRKAIHVVVCGGRNAEVLRQIDNLYMGGDGMLLEELLALAMAKAEEYHVYLVEGHGVGEAEVGVAQQTLMHIGHEVARVALAVGKDDLCLGVVDQQADELAARVACCT